MKGVVSMDSFEKLIVDLFESRGINIRDKVLSDAKMPLYIVASNLSKGKPAIFSGKVPVLDALKCSCAIPGVFIPQVLYNQLYIDGDMFCPSVDKFIPNLDHAICFSLKFRVPTNDLIPENIENMSPLTYIHSIYNMVTQNFSNQVKTDKTLDLYYEGLYSTSDISEVDIESIFKKAAHDLNRFLSAKSVLKELAE
jgi:predicted acylesterase/phospholipase RssA